MNLRYELGQLRRQLQTLEAYASGAPTSLTSQASSLAEMRANLSILYPTRQPIGYLIGADFNSTGDQAIALAGVGRWALRKIVVCNASISLTTAAGGLYTATSKGGVAIVAASQAYTALTNANKYLDLTLTATPGTDVLTVNTIYLSLTTAQGAAATADVFLFGDPLPAA